MSAAELLAGATDEELRTARQSFVRQAQRAKTDGDHESADRLFLLAVDCADELKDRESRVADVPYGVLARFGKVCIEQAEQANNEGDSARARGWTDLLNTQIGPRMREYDEDRIAAEHARSYGAHLLREARRAARLTLSQSIGRSPGHESDGPRSRERRERRHVARSTSSADGGSDSDGEQAAAPSHGGAA